MARGRPKGVPPVSLPEALRRMQITGQRDTAPELAIRSLLFGMDLRYRVDRSPLPGLRRRVFIVIVTARVAVYVGGCFDRGEPFEGRSYGSSAEGCRLVAYPSRDA
jgi:DNA mismatch endonuclease (patch repair protein)